MSYVPTGLAGVAVVLYVAVMLSPFWIPTIVPVNPGLASPYTRLLSAGVQILRRLSSATVYAQRYLARGVAHTREVDRHRHRRVVVVCHRLRVDSDLRCPDRHHCEVTRVRPACRAVHKAVHTRKVWP